LIAPLLPDSWLDLALAPPRAFGAPPARGRLRVEPEDFAVEEDLGFAPAGAGSHVLLKVRKRNANTEWVARELARAVGCRAGDVGYAGLKDRRAVTVQWFSVPMPRSAVADLAAIRGNDFEVLEAHPHTKKLPRGALAGNRFTIRIRDLVVDDAALTERVTAVAREGIPNFFGPQRFGHDGANLRKITRNPEGIHPRERTYVLSAARSLIFNGVLAGRVTEGTWNRLEAGDVANLDARGSVFPVDALDDTLLERAARLELHPTGPMWGRDEPLVRGRIRTLEQRVANGLEECCALVIAAGMRQERRSLRLAIRELQWHRDGADAVFHFWLTRGSFATTVLRELVDIEGEASAGEETG
jgi:tRNA pseudouridine13 synthase